MLFSQQGNKIFFGFDTIVKFERAIMNRHAVQLISRGPSTKWEHTYDLEIVSGHFMGTRQTARMHQIESPSILVNPFGGVIISTVFVKILMMAGSV